MDKIGMVEEIKPCPFCGGEASVGKSTYAKDSEITVLNGQNVFYSVNCHSCNGRRNLIGEKSHKEAIEKWNQRVEVKPATPAPTQPPVSAPEKCPDLTPEVKKLFHYSKRLADYVRLWMENGLNAGKIGDESGNSLWVPYRDLMEELKAFANADKEKL